MLVGSIDFLILPRGIIEGRCEAWRRSETAQRVPVPGEYEIPSMSDEAYLHSPWLSSQHFELIEQASMTGDVASAG